MSNDEESGGDYGISIGSGWIGLDWNSIAFMSTSNQGIRGDTHRIGNEDRGRAYAYVVYNIIILTRSKHKAFRIESDT